jgi:predicted nucleic acid-binding protein
MDMRRESRIYLDVCCLNRPFDDQNQDRVRLESEAVLTILGQVQRKQCVLISSEALETEIDENPDVERLGKVHDILRVASCYVKIGDRESARAKELGPHGFGGYDAVHVACAESAIADVLLTTDDGFVNAARRCGNMKVRVCNPLRWVAERNE